MVASYVPYFEYKQSGSNLLGEIPRSWVATQVKHVGSLKGGAGFPHAEQGVSNEVLDFHKVNALGKADSEGFLEKSENTISVDTARRLGAFIFPVNSIVFAKVGAALLLARIRYLKLNACIDNNMMGLVVHKRNDPSFVKYAMNIIKFDYIVNPGAVPSLNEFQMGNLYLAIPSLSEQQKIANFLDYETAKIDTLIDKQQQLIKLLKEKRQAVISHAVTKGLNPNAPMRDSGVEWLGEVPEHWDVKRLRYLGSCQNGINIGSEYFGEGYPFVSYGDAYKNEVLPECGSGLVQSTEQDRSTYSIVAGDVIFTRTSETVEEIGLSSTCLEGIADATFAGFLIRFRPIDNELYAGFSKYYFRNILMRTFFVKEMNLVTRASLSQDLLKKLPVTLPPIEEQKQIAELLDDKSEVFKKLTENAEAAIELMKERRTALISAAVTGKIDVRNWEAA